jgi:hypothetical protein
MTTQPTPSSQAISETAKTEGGTTKGSASAQMQSEMTKERNFEQAAQEIGSKMQQAPGNVNSEVRRTPESSYPCLATDIHQDAAYLKSREARVMGQGQPPSDSISADAERLAAANEGATKSQSGPLDPAEQSTLDRAHNFENLATDVASKMAKDPAHVTKEEADMLHSREQRAFGETSKGGIASQAQSLVS